MSVEEDRRRLQDRINHFAEEPPDRGALALGMLTIGAVLFAFGMLLGLAVGRAM